MHMPQLQRRWTVQDVHALPDDGNRYEVIDGELLVTPAPRTDRVAKRVLFREEGVPEYWIVDLDAGAIERSTLPDPRVEILDERLEWQPEGASKSLQIGLTEYFTAVLDQ